MKYRNSTNYEHGSHEKIGVLLTNLGTPDQPTKAALKRYLKQFLSDPRLVEPQFPRWVWLMILHGIILNVRPAKSAKAYESVWGKFGDGSPLMDISLKLLEKIRNQFAENNEYLFELGMRYGNPSIPGALRRLKEQGATRVIVLPMYPQYSASTTGSTFDEVSNELQNWRWVPEFRFINNYFKNDHYIQALADSIANHWKSHDQPDRLVFSYHGIPKRYHQNGDPYFCHCHATTRLVAEKLNLKEGQYMTTFQSIFGREEWLKPYTAETMKALPSKGLNHIQVICPGFSADCLETIEEIEEENKDYFLEAGGQKFSYIPALNDSDSHVKLLKDLICTQSSDWFEQMNSDHYSESLNRGLENFKSIEAKSK